MHQHDTVDRIGPTLEPDQQVVMHQNWHHLLFLHWEVPAAELQKLLPPRLTVDTFEGKAYVGLVPFTVTGARPILLPAVPGVSDFHEVNVRTYVHLDGVEPGVWFFSLDASSSIAVTAARAAYKLSYFHSAMTFDVTRGALPSIRMTARRDDPDGVKPADAVIRYTPEEGAVGPAAIGSLDFFLTERYVLYAADSHRQLYRARVHHQSYPLQKVRVDEVEETLVWAANIRRPSSAPLKHYAREVNVKVYALEKC